MSADDFEDLLCVTTTTDVMIQLVERYGAHSLRLLGTMTSAMVTIRVASQASGLERGSLG